MHIDLRGNKRHEIFFWFKNLEKKKKNKTKKNSAYYVIVEQIDEKVVSNDNITDDNCH